MSQQVLEKLDTGKSIAVNIYQEAETAIRQVEKFEKHCPSWAKATTSKSMRHGCIKWEALSDTPRANKAQKMHANELAMNRLNQLNPS